MTARPLNISSQGSTSLGENTQVPRVGGEKEGQGTLHSMQPDYRIPKAQLPLAHASEARGEDESLTSEDSPHGPHPFMGCNPFLGSRGKKELNGQRRQTEERRRRKRKAIPHWADLDNIPPI